MSDSYSLDQAYGSQEAAEADRAPVRVTVRPKPPTNTAPISLEDAYAHQPAPTRQDSPAHHTDLNTLVHQSNIETENKRLGGMQFTRPYIEEHRSRRLGEAEAGDDNNIYFKNEQGTLQPARTDQHVMLRDPESSKYHVYARHPSTDLGPVEGRLMGLGAFVQEGLASTSPVAGVASSRGARAVAAANRVEEATGEAVPISRAAVVEDPVRTTAANLASAIPGGNAPFQRAAEATRTGLERASAASAEIPTGSAVGVADAGQAARTGLTETVRPRGVLSQRVEGLYNAVDAHVNPDTTHALPNTTRVAQEISDAMRAAKRTDPYSGAVGEVMNAITDPKGLTYGGLKRLRTEIGEAIQHPGQVSGLSNADMKRVYGALTDDMRGLLNANGGPRAVSMFERANTGAAAAARQRETLGKILGADTNSDERIFNALAQRAGGTATADRRALALAKRSMPRDAWNEVTSAMVGRLGWLHEGTTSHFDPSRFVRDYGKMSEAGKSIVFGDSTRLRRALDNISRTTEESWGRARGLAKPTGEITHFASMVGMFHRPLEAIMGAIGANRLSNLLTRPATAENMARWMQSYKLVTISPTKGNIVAFNNASRILSQDAAAETRRDIGAGASKAKDAIYNGLRSLVGVR